MKRFLSVLVAMMLVFSMSAFAEDAIEEFEVVLDETYAAVDLGENYAYTYVPSDWLSIEAQYADESGELLGTFTNSDGTAMVMAVYTTSETGTTYEDALAEATAAGVDAKLAVFNGFEFLNMATITEDQIVFICSHFVDEECTSTVTFTFTFPTASMEELEPVMYQVLGGLNFYEE